MTGQPEVGVGVAGRCCAYACNMDAAEVLHFARKDAELTVRELAERAGVAASTVSRIERRQMDPTVGMLARLIAAAGLELELRSLHTYRGNFGALADALEVDPDGTTHPDWTRLRAVLDYLYLHPTLTQAAIADKPEPSGSELLDNLLAGIAEKLSDDAGLPRPSWTKDVPALTAPWISPGTPRMQAVDRSETPPQLAVRGITLAANNLWRDRRTEVA